MISDNLTRFYGMDVVDFQGAEDWKGTGVVYRFRVDWDSDHSVSDLVSLFCEQSSLDTIKAIVIGSWSGDDPSNTSESIVEVLVQNAGKLSGLKAIFFGDIISEENEISWINQSDLTPLLKAFPNLEHLTIRGGTDLAVGPLQHAGLKHLAIQTGGLNSEVVRSISQSEFPNLEHLELWLGTDNYGGTVTIEDLQPLLTGDLFSNLRYLGIRNTDGIDDMVPTIVNSPLLKRIEILDLSLGNLTDIGARSLLKLSENRSLKLVDLSHHYLTSDMQQALSKLPMKILLDDANAPDEEWRSIYASE